MKISNKLIYKYLTMKSFLNILKYITISSIFTLYMFTHNYKVYCGTELAKEILASKTLTEQTIMYTINLFYKNERNNILVDLIFHKIDWNYITEIKVLNNSKFKINGNEAANAFNHVLMTICVKNTEQLVSLYENHFRYCTGRELTDVEQKLIYAQISDVALSFFLTKQGIYDIFSIQGERLKVESVFVGNNLLSGLTAEQNINGIFQISNPNDFVKLILDSNNKEKLKIITKNFKGIDLFIKNLNTNNFLENTILTSIDDLLSFTAPKLSLNRLNSVNEIEVLSGELILNKSYAFNELSGQNYYKDLILGGNSSFKITESITFKEEINEITKKLLNKKNIDYQYNSSWKKK